MAINTWFDDHSRAPKVFASSLSARLELCQLKVVFVMAPVAHRRVFNAGFGVAPVDGGKPTTEELVAAAVQTAWNSGSVVRVLDETLGFSSTHQQLMADLPATRPDTVPLEVQPALSASEWITVLSQAAGVGTAPPATASSPAAAVVRAMDLVNETSASTHSPACPRHVPC